MTNKIIQLGLGVLIVGVMSACIVRIYDDDDERSGDGAASRFFGSGTPAHEERELPTITRLKLDGSADVEVRIGTEQRVVVFADDNLLDRVTTEVFDGELVVGMRSGSYSTRSQIRIELETTSLEAIEIRGSGDVSAEGLDAPKLEISVSGSGDVRAQGRVERLSASISGSGDLELGELSTRRARVSISGSGDVNVNVEESLDAKIAGTGDIHYSGDPHELIKSVTGSGDVEHD
jgi:hypothetical protein